MSWRRLLSHRLSVVADPPRPLRDGLVVVPGLLFCGPQAAPVHHHLERAYNLRYIRHQAVKGRPSVCPNELMRVRNGGKAMTVPPIPGQAQEPLPLQMYGMLNAHFLVQALQVAATLRVAESSKKRHTVLLTFEDDSLLVLYQEPRRKGPHLQEVRLRNGAFSPPDILARADGNLVLRLENDDHRAWQIAISDNTIEQRKLDGGTTTEILIRAPANPGEIVVTNVDRRNHSLRIRFTAPTELAWTSS